MWQAPLIMTNSSGNERSTICRMASQSLIHPTTRTSCEDGSPTFGLNVSGASMPIEGSSPRQANRPDSYRV